ncbi:MAG TPA: antitoxin family protein [Pirellulales bacterium]
MTMTIAAIYENGLLKPQQPLELADGAMVQLIIHLWAPAASWSEKGEERRRELIDKDVHGAITSDELVELEILDQLANEHFDRVAPPPIDGARRLHERLSK